MAAILDEVAERHEVPLSALKGPRRTRIFSRPRQEFMYLAYRTGRWSMPQIGLFLGGRDHTGILHGIKAHCRRNDLAYPVRSGWRGHA